MASVWFPFEFLHAELVRYMREWQSESEKIRKEFLHNCDDQTGGDASTYNEQISSVQRICLQSNAETRLEAIGFRIGYVLVEKMTKDIPRLMSELDKMKFICKEFWTVAFGKQEVFVVQDNRFFTVINFADSNEYLKESAMFLALPCGVIRGALNNLGIESIVTATTEVVPLVKFNVQLQKK